MKLLSVFFLALLTSCTTHNKIYSSDGKLSEYVECGATTSMNICYNRAKEICPLGYKTLDSSEGFNRKTLTFRCNEK